MMYAIMKIAGMLLVIVCTTSIGIAMARALSRRVEELEAGIAVLGGLESELSYTLAPPDEAVGRLEQRDSLAGAAFLPACASYCRQGLAFPVAWRKAVEENHGELTPDDVLILTGLADTLGQCDLEGQLARVAHAKAQLQLQLDGARVRCCSHSKLYRTMGLLSGTFIVILFI